MWIFFPPIEQKYRVSGKKQSYWPGSYVRRNSQQELEKKTES